MKKISSVCAAFMLLCLCTNSQNLAISGDGSPPEANAIPDVKSNNKGVLRPTDRIKLTLILNLNA